MPGPNTASAQIMHKSVPPPHAVADIAMDDGAIIRVRRHGDQSAPRVMLSHGNGFAIDGYFPFWRPLLDDFDVVVFDQRDHGQNPRHDEAGHTYRQVARDARVIRAGIDARFGAKPTAGIFHSLSAVANIHANALDSVAWGALVLVDPALLTPGGPEREASHRFEHVLAKWARGRPNRFNDPAELAAQFRASRAASLWLPEAFELMARAVTRPAASGGFELSCPPEWEARIYLDNIGMGTWPLLSKLQRQAMFLGADPALPAATPAAAVVGLAAQEAGLPHVVIPGTSHTLQIERPDLCVAAVRSFFAKVGFGPA
jgi:pimeloyl-ACP methyl ester carboxylesterase